jgi:hypothetical protein
LRGGVHLALHCLRSGVHLALRCSLAHNCGLNMRIGGGNLIPSDV